MYQQKQQELHVYGREREKGGGGEGGLLSYFSRKTVTRFSAKAFGEQF